ncbi:MAG: sugar phosphate isomerase/epimerase family protein [Anaerolineae bacterium]
MKYSISNWIYGNEPLPITFQRLQKYGYDGVELVGEPQRYDIQEVKGLCQKFGLSILSVLGWSIWPLERDLAHPDPQMRDKALKYAAECVDLAVAVGAPLVVVIPASAGRTGPVGQPGGGKAWKEAVAREWDYAVESVKAAAAYAEERGVLIAIEPINRYESFLVNNVDQGLRFVQEVNSEVVKLHLDAFHMNIEDHDPAEAVRKAGDLLINMHISDSNRGAVGYGHTDFKAIIRVLKESDYQGILTMEPVPPAPDAFMAISMEEFLPLRDVYAEECITRLRQYEREV